MARCRISPACLASSFVTPPRSYCAGVTDTTCRQLYILLTKIFVFLVLYIGTGTCQSCELRSVGDPEHTVTYTFSDMTPEGLCVLGLRIVLVTLLHIRAVHIFMPSATKMESVT